MRKTWLTPVKTSVRDEVFAMAFILGRINKGIGAGIGLAFEAHAHHKEKKALQEASQTPSVSQTPSRSASDAVTPVASSGIYTLFLLESYQGHTDKHLQKLQGHSQIKSMPPVLKSEKDVMQKVKISPILKTMSKTGLLMTPPKIWTLLFILLSSKALLLTENKTRKLFRRL